jgi:hypothetical protein
MYKNLRPVFIALLSAILLFSCVKKADRKQVEENLKAAMDLYLNHKPGMDTARLKFTVLGVAFFEDKKFYRCEFQVDMKDKSNGQIKDTTGSMGANISKDFRNVSRSY